MSELKSTLLDHPHALVGEIGLDKVAKDKDSGARIPMELQILVFRHQLDLALELGRHVSVHSVRCWNVMIDMMRAFDFGQESNVMMHSFSGSKVFPPSVFS